eukprot:1419146-Heterocapsa_arctica.AAC.1
MADDIEASPGFDKNAPREDNGMTLNPHFRNAIAGRFLQFFGTTNRSAEDMYTKRGQMAAEVTNQLKLSQAANRRGRAHQPKLPAISAKHAGKSNPLADMIKAAAKNPRALTPAPPRVDVALPAYIKKSQAHSAADRSRSAPVPRP